MRRRWPGAAIAVAALVATGLAACGGGGNETDVTIYTGTASPTSGVAPSSVPTAEPTTPPTSDPTTEPVSPTTSAAPSGPPQVVSTIVTGLTAPWGLDFFADGDAIVTERDTRRVLRITATGQVTVLGVVGAARPSGGSAENGLLGVALSPDFATDSYVYLYLTTAVDNRVVRTTLRGDRLGTDLDVMLDGIPQGFRHDGGRLEFGPDGLLYVSTGETTDGPLAQDKASLGGKILRLTPDGALAPGNPFGTAVFSYGHRNVQGLAFDSEGHLWASEFGDHAFDELNRIQRGGNYGWPEVEGKGGAPTYVDPQQVWGTEDNSPSGLAYADGALWMAALEGERVYRVTVDGARAVRPRSYFVGDYGRLRTIERAPDGTLWVTTSNRDGRGSPRAGDDRILRVRP